MNAVPFDTLRMAQRLEAAGFSAPQAAGASEALAEALVGADLATKSDISDLRAEMKSEFAALRAEMKGDSATIRAETKSDSASVRAEIKSEFVLVRRDMELLRRDVTLRLSGMMIAGVGVILAALRYLPPHP